MNNTLGTSKTVRQKESRKKESKLPLILVIHFIATCTHNVSASVRLSTKHNIPHTNTHTYTT